MCGTYVKSIRRDHKILIFSTYNDFKLPEKSPHLPELDIISKRLISPWLQFMQMKRLSHFNGQYAITGQVINVLVEVSNIVTTSLRNVDDNFRINVHI